MSKKRIVLGTPTLGSINYRNVLSILDVFQTGLLTNFIVIPRLPIHQSRTKIASMFLASGGDYLLFADDDMTYTGEDLKKLLEADKDIICGLCNVRTPGNRETKPVIFQKVKDKYFFRGDALMLQEVGKIEKIDAGTLAFCLIKKEVFDKIGPVFGYGKDGGEDLDFFRRATDAGFEVYVDPKVMIGHIKETVI